MVGWHHQLTGHEFEQTAGDSERQRSLACCRPWGRRVRHDFVTEQQQFCFFLHVLRRYGGGREVQEEGDICKPMADSC